MAAAAAAWSRSRGVAGVRATTGLFSIFTLLCLVCLSSSLIHKDQLEELKERLDKLKAFDVPAMDTAKQQAGIAVSLMESLDTFMKANKEALPDDSLHLLGFVQGMKDYVKGIKNKVDEKDEKMRPQIESIEKELERRGLHEEQHADL